jgi:hypothetical protein
MVEGIGWDQRRCAEFLVSRSLASWVLIGDGHGPMHSTIAGDMRRQDDRIPIAATHTTEAAGIPSTHHNLGSHLSGQVDRAGRNKVEVSRLYLVWHSR